MTRHNGMPDPDFYNDPQGERQVTHAGHPLSATRWCVDDGCDAAHKRAEGGWKSAVEAPGTRMQDKAERKDAQ